MLNLEQKKAVVAEVAGVAASAQSAIAAEYCGLSVDAMTTLRKEARSAGVYMRVVKNTLAKRAVDGTDFDCLKDVLTGPLILAFSQEDPAAAARVIRTFAKDHDQLVVKAIALSGKLMGASELARLADMPTREQALGMLLGVMQAPISKFARTLNEVPGKLVRTMAAVRDQKQAS